MFLLPESRPVLCEYLDREVGISPVEFVHADHTFRFRNVALEEFGFDAQHSSKSAL